MRMSIAGGSGAGGTVARRLAASPSPFKQALLANASLGTAAESALLTLYFEVVGGLSHPSASRWLAHSREYGITHQLHPLGDAQHRLCQRPAAT